MPIVFLSHKLRVGERSVECTQQSQAVRKRHWTDLPTEEECVIHLELTQKCLAKRVSDTVYHITFWGTKLISANKSYLV